MKVSRVEEIVSERIAKDLPAVVETKEEVKSNIEVKQQHHARKIIQQHEVNKRDEAALDVVIKDYAHKDFIECEE